MRDAINHISSEIEDVLSWDRESGDLQYFDYLLSFRIFSALVDHFYPEEEADRHAESNWDEMIYTEEFSQLINLVSTIRRNQIKLRG